MNNYLTKSLALFILLISSVNIYASENITCNTCVDQHEFYGKMYSKVSSLMDYRGYNGDVFVANLQTGTVYGWRVDASYTLGDFENDPQVRIRSYNITIPTDMQSAVREAKDIISQQSKTTVPADSGFSSAWDIARISANRVAFDQWLFENETFLYVTVSLTSSVGGYFFGGLSGIELLFEFADGSTVLFKAAQSTSANLTFTYVPGSATDKDGNTIPDAGVSLEGIYLFDTTAAQYEFINNASQHGSFSVVFSVATGGRYRITITPNAVD